MNKHLAKIVKVILPHAGGVDADARPTPHAGDVERDGVDAIEVALPIINVETAEGFGGADLDGMPEAPVGPPRRPGGDDDDDVQSIPRAAPLGLS